MSHAFRPVIELATQEAKDDYDAVILLRDPSSLEPRQPQRMPSNYQNELKDSIIAHQADIYLLISSKNNFKSCLSSKTQILPLIEIPSLIYFDKMIH